MDTNITNTIQDSLAKNQRIGIVMGKNPSLDVTAAALSLYLILKEEGKQVVIASPTNPLVEVSSLVGIDKIKNSLDGDGGDLIVSFPYREGEIEKVSYTLEDGFLNIVVKAGEEGLSFEEKDIRYKRGGSLPTLLFVIGTPRLSDLGQLFDPENLKEVTLVNIDNKAENQGFGDIVALSPGASSVCEQMAQLLSSLGIKLDVDIAQNLLSGIAQATENFQHPKTSVTAFETAATLMRLGAVRPRVSYEQQVSDTVAPFFNTNQSRQTQTHGEQRQQQRRPDNRQFPRQQQQQRQHIPPASPRGEQQVNQSQGLGQNFLGGVQAQSQPMNPLATQGGSASPTLGGQPQKQTPAPVVEKDDQDTPPDWLTPKVYKGSTLV